jgi:outer membrane protein TolC
MEDFERASVALATKKLYYAAVALAMQRQAVDAGIGKLRTLEGSYQLMEAPTSASTTSYLVAKSVRENLEADGVRLDCERTKALRDLNALMGDDPDADITLVDPLPAVAGITPNEVETRPDVAASEARVRSAEAERTAALRRWGPNVDFFSAYDVFTGDFQDAKGSYEVGARLSWPVFDWGRQADIRATKAMRAQAEYRHRAATLHAKADLRTAESNVVSCVKRYRIVEQAFGSANQALTQAMTRYKEGTLPLMDYSQAIQNWVQMKMNLIGNRLNVATAHAEYDFQRGGI